MNILYITILCVGAGPFSSAIKHNTPLPDANWQTVAVDSTTIELPIPVQKAYERVAPTNYNVPTPTTRVPVWCPYHGYSCGMSKITEDLLNHLQTEHGITLEYANELGRDKWKDLHDDLHWEKETVERQELFLHPQNQVIITKPASGCATGNCPKQQYSLPTTRRGIFR